ncbi:iron uptake system protein EfeO [Catenulispora subtropica]|uniref:Iron uptake system protein EfeO n=1 Tax=Catenulispora subtropica TaxID=450798 RepID=A0ABP5E2V4_9ACTN
MKRTSARTAARSRAAFAALAVTALAAGALAGCGSSTSAKPSGAQPAAATSSTTAGDPHKAVVTVTAAGGCAVDHADFQAGQVTFEITNKDATAVSEIELQTGQRIIGEKENLPPGFNGSFTVALEAGSYSLVCPGSGQPTRTITVTGNATTSADADLTTLLAQGAKEYKTYVDTQAGYLVQTTQALASSLKGADLAAAQKAYMMARPYYEKIEPVAESFAVGSDDLDKSLDARADDVPPAEWAGFHRIEKGLFEDENLAGLAAYGDALVANVQKLRTLTTALEYKPFELANGAQELLDEVSKTKVTGEEERYSHIDLLDFHSNVEGSEQAFADLKPALQKIDPALTGSIADAFTALDKLLDTYRTGDNPSGFVLYGTLKDTDKPKLVAAVKAVQEPLSQVAAKVAKS